MNAGDALQGISIAVAPNGGRRTKADHPAIPLTPEELALTARDCLDAGAAMIHVHVRKGTEAIFSMPTPTAPRPQRSGLP